MDSLLINLGCGWIHSESKKAQYDSIAKNIITSSLYEFSRLSQCAYAKEMWDTLEVMHKGTNDVKKIRKHSLIQEYELLRMKPWETIANVQKRLTHIMNHLIGLGKVFDKKEINIKILKCTNLDVLSKFLVVASVDKSNLESSSKSFGLYFRFYFRYHVLLLFYLFENY